MPWVVNSKSGKTINGLLVFVVIVVAALVVADDVEGVVLSELELELEFGGCDGTCGD